MTERKTESATAAPNELVIIRVFAAPRALVWKMFTEIKHALAWGWPRDYPMHLLEADLRPGGTGRGHRPVGGRALWPLSDRATIKCSRDNYPGVLIELPRVW